jgi:hypothetical protein
VANEWEEFGTDDDWGYEVDSDFGGNSASDGISSYNQTEPSGVITIVPGLVLPELASANFNGSIPRQRVYKAKASIVAGMQIYLKDDNTPYSDTGYTWTESELAYPVVLNVTGTLSILKEGNIIALNTSSWTSVYVIEEAWTSRTDGDSGWAITSGGNAIFTNVSVRGEVNAESGYFGDDPNTAWNIGSGQIYSSYGSGNNLLFSRDYDFESGSYDDYWTIVNGGTAISPTFSTFGGDAKYGTYSLRMGAFSPSGGTISSLVATMYASSSGPVRFTTPLTGTYTFSAYVKSLGLPAGASGTAASNATLTVRVYNSSGVQLNAYSNTPTTINTSSWTRVHNVFTFPANAASYQLEVTTNANVTLSSTPGAYFVAAMDYVALQEGSQIDELLTTIPMEFYLNSTNTSTYAIELKYSAQDSFTLTPSGAFTAAGTGTVSKLRITSPGEVSLTSTSHGFQIGDSGGANIILDTNEFQARNNGSASSLNIQNNGGNLILGGSGTSTTINGSDVTLGTTTQFLAQDIYDSTSGTTANVIVGSAGRLRRISSTQDVKDNIYNLSNNEISSSIDVNKISNTKVFDPYSVLELSSVSFSLINDERDATVIGFIAEDIADKSPELAEYDDNGKPIYFNIGGIAAAMLVVIQDQQDRIKSLEERLAILEG